MELRQLRYFVAIAATGSVSRAAQQVHVAQSALSYQLAQLEREVGSELVHRLPRGVLLTEAGTVFLVQAKAVLKSAREAILSVKQLESSPIGKVTFGFPPSISGSLAVPLLKTIRTELPSVELELTEELTGTLAANLSENTVDLAILIDDGSLPRFSTLPLIREQLCLIAPAGHPLTKRIPLAEALALPLLLPCERQGVRPLVDAIAKESGLPPPNVIAEINSVSILRSSLLAGVGYTILSPMAFNPELEAGSLVAISIDSAGMERTLALCSSHTIPPSTAQKAVAALTVRVFKDLVKDGSWKGACPID